jgi:hypothetical protein
VIASARLQGRVLSQTCDFFFGENLQTLSATSLRLGERPREAHV